MEIMEDEWKKRVEVVKSDFVKIMEDEWRKRVEVVKNLQVLKSKVRLNRFQCNLLIDTYSTLEVLTLHPENYLAIIDEDQLNISDEDGSDFPVSFQTPDDIEKVHYNESCLVSCTASLRNSFLELSRIMHHGKTIISECACEDWIGRALTKMTIIPKNDWGIVTPCSLHLQKLQWILGVIGKGIEELWSIPFLNSGTLLSVQNEIKMFTISLPNSEIDVEESDRQLLLNDLLVYLNESSSSEDEKNQLASFIIWRLQNKVLPLAVSQSSESLGVTRNPECEAERFGRNRMRILRNLGNGSFSVGVTAVDWLGIKVALKQLKTEEDFVKEIEFADLQHPHIVQVFDHWIGEEPFIMMELMDMSLYSFMEKNCKDRYPSIEWAIDVMHQLAEAMKYLTRNRVIHRDLKSMNVLMRHCPCNEGCEEVIVKLADFGTSKFSPEEFDFTTVVGTPMWMAPEVLHEGSESHGYTTAVDIYSFAITCSEILTGKSPFYDKGNISRSELKKRIKGGLRPELPEYCPKLLSAYLHRCWASNPEERPQHFSEICEFLLYCKGNQLRDGLPSILSSINDKDAQVLLTHLGTKLCLMKNEITGSPRYVSIAIYERIMLAIHEDTWSYTWDESECLQAVDFFDKRRCYDKAAHILQRWEGFSMSAEGTWRLGYYFELGLGVAQDFVKAVSLYQKTCELDPIYASAYVELGRCYAMGRGVERNMEIASEFWEKALECQGNLKSIDEQIKISCTESESEYQRKAKQRILELTATKSGRKLLVGKYNIVAGTKIPTVDPLMISYCPSMGGGSKIKLDVTKLKLLQHIHNYFYSDTRSMWDLMAATLGALFTSYNEKGKPKFFATCGRLLIFLFLISRMGLPAILLLRPTLQLSSLKDIMLCALGLVVLVSIVHSQVREAFRGERISGLLLREEDNQ